MLCTHKTTFSASLDYFVTSSPPYLHQFSTIFGGNCIRLTSLIVRLPSKPVESKLYSTRTFDAITRSHRSYPLRRQNSTRSHPIRPGNPYAYPSYKSVQNKFLHTSHIWNQQNLKDSSSHSRYFCSHQTS